MTPEETNIAIAEYRGWTDIHGGPPDGTYWRGTPPSGKGCAAIPNCSGDRNAMREGMNSLDWDGAEAFVRYLDAIILQSQSEMENPPPYEFHIINAEPEQLAEAFCRTVKIGKWKEGV